MNLATLQLIKNIEEIPGADKIEKATVLGWEVVVKKGDFNIGDPCIYIQIDSVVPERIEFEFLRERDFRVKTIKLRKQISQGLILKLDDLPETKGKVFTEGDDLSELIGVKKYEKKDNNPVRFEKPKMPKVWYKKWIYLFKYNILYKMFPSLRKKLRSRFPTDLVSITDEERIQNIPQTLEKYKGKEFIVSYKLDGSSITIIHNKIMGKSKYRICSRRFELHDKKNDWHRVFTETEFKKYIDKLTRHYCTDDIIVQGECIGHFNGNHHKLYKDEIRLFNIFVNGKRLSPAMFFDICFTLDIPHCPKYKRITLNHTMKEILEMSNLSDCIAKDVQAEGLVWRDMDNTISFKVINNLYLMKEQ